MSSAVELQPLNKTKKVEEESPEPEDKGNLVFYIILLHGIGTLMPWNMLITISYDVSFEIPTKKITDILKAYFKAWKPFFRNVS